MGLTILAWHEFLEVQGAPSNDSKVKSDPEEDSTEKHMGMDTEKDTLVRTNVQSSGPWIILLICFGEWR